MKSFEKCKKITGPEFTLQELIDWDLDNYKILAENDYINYSSHIYYQYYQACLKLWFIDFDKDTTGWYDAYKHKILHTIIYYFPEHMYTLDSLLWSLKLQLLCWKGYLFNSLDSNNWTSYEIFGPYDGQMTFQDGHSPIMEGILGLHHDIMFFMVVILIFVCWMLGNIMYRFNHNKNAMATYNTHGTVIEIVWTLIPSFLLILIAIPTFALLYSLDEGIEPTLTLKVIGHQWYWSYEIAYSYTEAQIASATDASALSLTTPEAIKSALIKSPQVQKVSDISVNNIADYTKFFVADWIKYVGNELPNSFKTTNASEMSWVVFNGWDISAPNAEVAKYIDTELLPNNQLRYEEVTKWIFWPTKHLSILQEAFSNANSDFVLCNNKYLMCTPVHAPVVSDNSVEYITKDYNIAFDSFMIPEKELDNPLQLRLLEVDAPVLLPIDTHIRVLVSSADVLHSWAVPALGVKLDAVAGRLNQLAVYINKIGTYYGQCSEICGPNHAFMPIVIHGVTWNDFEEWLASFD
jgi:heme/copper-type cytochrome/quinol oxidase subunit 2